MAFADTWHIRSRARECAATEQAFTEGEEIITALFPDPESSGYLRKDFKVEAWNAREDGDAPAFSFWRSRYESPETGKKEDPMEKEDPESLLRRLIDEDEEHTENVRYILAVMLERKKLLRETDSQRTPSGILRIYEHRKEGDVFIVRDPDIPLDEVEKVQEEVIVLLETGGRIPEPEPEMESPDASRDDVPSESEEEMGAPDSSGNDESSEDEPEIGAPGSAGIENEDDDEEEDGNDEEKALEG